VSISARLLEKMMDGAFKPLPVEGLEGIISYLKSVPSARINVLLKIKRVPWRTEPCRCHFLEGELSSVSDESVGAAYLNFHPKEVRPGKVRPRRYRARISTYGDQWSILKYDENLLKNLP